MGSFGNPLRLVRPTLIRLNVSRFVNSSLRPTMLVLLQLSRFNSAIWKHIHIHTVPKINFHYITQTKQASTVSNVNMLWVEQTEKWSLIYKNNHNFLYLTLDKNWSCISTNRTRFSASLQSIHCLSVHPPTPFTNGKEIHYIWYAQLKNIILDEFWFTPWKKQPMLYAKTCAFLHIAPEHTAPTTG